MDTAFIDPLRTHILHCIDTHRGGMTSNMIRSVAENIAFLIRHQFGPGISNELERISIPIIYVPGAEAKRKATVYVHEKSEGSGKSTKLTVIVKAEVKEADNVVEELAKEVDFAVNKIMMTTEEELENRDAKAPDGCTAIPTVKIKFKETKGFKP